MVASARRLYEHVRECSYEQRRTMLRQTGVHLYQTQAPNGAGAAWVSICPACRCNPAGARPARSSGETSPRLRQSDRFVLARHWCNQPEQCSTFLEAQRAAPAGVIMEWLAWCIRLYRRTASCSGLPPMPIL